MKYLTTTPQSWGIGATMEESKKKARSNLRRDDRTGFEYKTYAIHHNTRVFGDGSWEYPQGCPPVLLNSETLGMRSTINAIAAILDHEEKQTSDAITFLANPGNPLLNPSILITTPST